MVRVKSSTIEVCEDMGGARSSMNRVKTRTRSCISEKTNVHSIHIDLYGLGRAVVVLVNEEQWFGTLADADPRFVTSLPSHSAVRSCR